MAIIAHAQIDAAWPAGQDLVAGSAYEVFLGPAATGPNYATPANPQAIPAWPDLAAKAGDGLGADGGGPDGFGEGGCGDGEGCDGCGPDGIGTLLRTHRLAAVADGDYDVAVVAVDPAGNFQTPAAVEAAVTIAGLPAAPGPIAPTDYDTGTDELTLEYALSADDEG